MLVDDKEDELPIPEVGVGMSAGVEGVRGALLFSPFVGTVLKEALGDCGPDALAIWQLAKAVPNLTVADVHVYLYSIEDHKSVIKAGNTLVWLIRDSWHTGTVETINPDSTLFHMHFKFHTQWMSTTDPRTPYYFCG